MKKRSFVLVVLTAACLILGLTGCHKDEKGVNPVSEEGVLKLNVIADNIPVKSISSDITKSSPSLAKGESYIDALNDGRIETLEVFVFNNSTGELNGALDNYLKYSAGDVVSNIEIKAPQGDKLVYVVANSHLSNWVGVVNLNSFLNQISNLKSEKPGSYTMAGYGNVTLGESTNINISITRLISKVILEEVKTAFAGTPYAGMKLSNVKAYITNVYGNKHFNGTDVDTPVLLNYKKFIEADTLSCAIVGMLCEIINEPIGDAGFHTPLYFYAYENMITTETLSDRFTKLVIQADIDGKRCYYPIPVNRVNYGYTSSSDHSGVRRNTIYRLKVTIKRIGSDNPDDTIVMGALNISVSIVDWSSEIAANIEF